MYDYYLGGKDNFPADRDAADAAVAAHPHLPEVARNNRGFLRRAVAFAADEGIDQFLDIGSGIPTSPNVHEIARRAQPGARIVYVDNDPVVLAHGRALLVADDDIAIVEGDMLDPDTILTDPRLRATIDFARPVAVLLVAVLHFSRDLGPAQLVAPYRELMVPGSLLVLSHGSTEGLSQDEMAGLEDAYRTTPTGARLRPREHILDAFDGFELLEPGLVDVSQWRGFARATQVQILAGVGRRH